jgi:DGQHR domain-containing protein
MAEQVAEDYDVNEGIPVPCMVVDQNSAVAVMPVKQLLSLVLDPIASQDARITATNPQLASYASLRGEVQRLVEGAKEKNSVKYGSYLVAGLRDGNPWIVPPITLYHPTALKLVRIGQTNALVLPFGDFFVAIDGETQRIAWQRAVFEHPAAADRKIAVVIHHGKPVDHARQAFYDLNTREVKPNTAVSIAMDTQDFATRVTRSVIAASAIINGRVHTNRRQLRRNDRELLTISALRTGVVTTLLGGAGLQVGSRPVDLPPDVDQAAAERIAVAIWTSILELLAPALAPNVRTNSVAPAPAVLAGIGVVAHHSMPAPPRRPDVPHWSPTQLLETLRNVTWARQVGGASPWEGIAGKTTPMGKFSIGGPKEVGYAVAQALEQADSRAGQAIRQPWSGLFDDIAAESESEGGEL